MKKRIRCINGVLLTCSLLVAGCKDTPPASSGAEYEVMAVTPSDRVLLTTYSATIRGRQDIEIYPQVSGTLTKLLVAEGQKVKQGQTLFVIDQVPYQTALETALANVEVADATLATATLTYESKVELFKENVISEFDLNTAKNNMLTAKAQVAQTKAQEINARNNLSYTVVKSPVDGVIGTLPYRVGTLVNLNMPKALTTVSDNSDMYVYFSMTENQLLELIRQYGSKDKALQQMPPIELRLNDQSMYTHKGKIETISGVIDLSTGTVSLRAVFPNKEELLHSGGTGNVIIPIQKTNTPIIPQSATFEVQDKIYIYRIVDGKATSGQIKITRINDGKEYIVEEGLTVGDTIIVEGVGLLREGTPIKPKNKDAKVIENQKPEK